MTKVEWNGEWKESKHDIEETLFPINEGKIRASEDTPFLQEPLYSTFGERGIEQLVDQVLEGSFPIPEGLDEYTKLLIKHLRKPDQVPELATEYITTEEHTSAWRKAREYTAAGMSGIHFGMFKAHSTRHHLAEIDASMRSVAYCTGFAYGRWKKGVDVQLLKRAKLYIANKLRTILLLEADFNMNNKKMGREAMQAGEDTRTHTRDNYGGRRGLRAAEIAMNYQLTMDSLRARRGRAILISNDAKGCYDRIAHVVCKMALRRLGIPNPPLQSMIETIQEMEHHICTAFGVSEDFYCTREGQKASQGVLQGNGAGPASWFAICSVLVEAMRAQGFGYSQWSVISKRAITLTCFAFVDDTDLIHANDSPNVSTDDLIAEAQEALWTWEGLLKATGGALADDKSYWYLIEMEKKRGKWQYKTNPKTQDDLFLNNRGNPVKVKRLDTDNAQEALGIKQRPDGAMDDEVEYLESKAIEWAEAVRTKKLSKREAWHCLNSTIMKTIEYPLVATTFSRKQIDQIMQPILQVILQKCGIQKYFPRSLLYGSIRAQGCNLHDPWATQLIEHVQAILRHQSKDTPSADLHIETMELVQCHVGTGSNFWSLPFNKYGCLAPDGWMKTTWEAMDETPLELRGPDLAFPTLRTNDRHIMEVFADMEDDDLILQSLNECRLFLGVTTVAEIATADGLRLEQEIWHGRSTLVPPNNWPKAKPSENDWILWKDALRRALLLPHSTSLALTQPLGPWTEQGLGRWRWWVHHETNRVYEILNDEFIHKWYPIGDGNASPRFGNPTRIPRERLPPNLLRCSVRRQIAGLRITLLNRQPETINNQHAATPNATTLESSLRHLPTDAHWAIQRTTCPDNGASVATAITQGRLRAVGDGSLKIGKGTSAFVLEPVDQRADRIQGVNIVPGPIEEGDSHRCELASLYAIALLVCAICEIHNITSGSVHVACDNQQAIRIFESWYLADPQHKNFDLEQAILNVLKDCPIKWIPHHVKGHQDDHRAYHRLDRFAQLNVQMDAMAKAFWRHSFVHSRDTWHSTADNQHIYKEGWTVWNDNVKMQNPNRASLYTAIQDPKTIAKWIRLGRLSEEAVTLIDWAATQRLGRSVSPALQRWITKHGSHECGVGCTLVKWKKQDDNACPRCGYPESTDHVLQCKDSGAQEVWQSGIEELQEFLTTSHAHPLLAEAIVSNIQRWRNSLPPITEFGDQAIDRIAATQSTIGWRNLLEGLPSFWIARTQQQHLIEEDIHASGKGWTQALLSRLLQLARSMWIHRNEMKHRTLRPRHKRMERLLDNAITKAYVEGARDLPPDDRAHYNINLVALLQKNISYKQGWLLNVVAARNRQNRRVARRQQLQINSNLIRWMKTGRTS